MSKQQTQRIDQTTTTQQVDVMDKVNTSTQTIADAVTANLLAARAAATDVLKAFNKEVEAKGAGQAAMVRVLWELYMDGRKYVTDLTISDDADTEALKRRTAAIKLACADAGFTAFLTPEAKERSWVSPIAKRAPQTMRSVAPVVLRMIKEGITPATNAKGMLKVPGRFLLSDEERKDEANADILDKPLTLDYTTKEGATTYGFRKSFERAKELAGKELGIVVSKRAPQTADTKVSEPVSLEASIKLVTETLRRRQQLSKELVAEIHTLYAAVSFFLGAANEAGTEVNPAVANLVLREASQGK